MINYCATAISKNLARLERRASAISHVDQLVQYAKHALPKRRG
jgi:hypothetical protein